MKKIFTTSLVFSIILFTGFMLTNNKNENLISTSYKPEDDGYTYVTTEVDSVISSSVEEFQAKYSHSLALVSVNETLEESYNYPVKYGTEDVDSSQMFSITDATVTQTIEGEKLDENIKILSYVNYDNTTQTVNTFGQRALLPNHEYALYISPVSGEDMEYLVSLGVPESELANIYSISDGSLGTIDLSNKTEEPLENVAKKAIERNQK